MDWQKLGLKAGIEIHQQLNTEKKLFCSCPTTIRDDQPDVIVKRRLRALAGETGEMDVAAAYEKVRGKYFVYQAYNNTICDIELDEEPIHEINNEALKLVLQVSAMLRAKPVDLMQVMRKTVIDGSNTSGFQRTALVATHGTLVVGGAEISVPTVCIEEEAAKIVERTGEFDVYNLSRLGIPLVEIATGPDMKTPEQVKETAEYIGMILRSTGRVKRGLGTIRQDVNVSIKGGTRVEIKGAQDLRMVAKLVEYEAMRQQGLVSIVSELKNKPAAVDGKILDLTKIFSNTSSDLIKAALSKNGILLATKLEGFKGLIGKEFEGVPGRRLGKELSEYAKAFAGVGGILHSDELPKYGITAEEVSNVSNELGCVNSDAFVIIAAEKNKAESAIHAVISRAKQALKGVPSEVRKANEDGTTTFLRPMPGSARMYPETDIPLVKISTYSKNIKLPRLLIEKVSDYQKIGLSNDLAKAILASEYAIVFEYLSGKCKKLSPAYVAETLMSYEKSVIALGIAAEAVEKITDETVEAVLAAVDSGKLAKESVIPALADAAKTGKLDLSKYESLSDAELEKELKAIVDSNKNLQFNALIGKAMEKLRGKAPGHKIVELLKALSK